MLLSLGSVIIIIYDYLRKYAPAAPARNLTRDGNVDSTALSLAVREGMGCLATKLILNKYISFGLCSNNNLS